MQTYEINLRHGFAIDRAERCLAHAIAIKIGDFDEAKKLSREVRADGFSAGLAKGLRNADLALFVIGHIDQSRDRLPV